MDAGDLSEAEDVPGTDRENGSRKTIRMLVAKNC